MLQKLRHILLSLPVLTAAGLFALYLGVGFWGLPALMKWQGEKLVREELGQNLVMADVRVNPLLFKLEVRDLALSGEQGQPMLGFQRLLVDFELWRSLVDQTWTFASVSLQAPNLRLELQQNGRHNFSAMLDKLSGADAEPLEAAPWPRLAVQQLAVMDAQIDVSEQLLAEPLITRIAPLTVTVDGLSTVATQAASYRFTALTAQGESLSSDGSLTLNPVAIKGQLALKEIQVRTLARALSRLVAIDAPAGQIAASLHFDLAVDAQNQLAGTLQDVELGVTALSLSAPGGTAPLLAVEKMGLKEGRVDLGQRQVNFAHFTCDNGRVNASTNSQGRLDWTTLVRPSADTPSESPVGAPWRVSIANTTVASVAVHIQDARQGLRAKIDSVTLTGSSRGEFGASGLTLQLSQPSLVLAGARLERPGKLLTVPALQATATQARITRAAETLELSLDMPNIRVAQGVAAQDSHESASAGEASIQADRATMTQAGPDTRASLSGTRLALAGATINQGGQSATLREWIVQGKDLTLQSKPGQSGVILNQWRSTLSQLKAQRGTETAAVDQMLLNGAAANIKQLTNGPLYLSLQGAKVETRGTALHRGDDRLALRSANLAAERLSLTQENGRLKLDGRSANLGLKGLAAQQGENNLSLEDGEFKASQLALNTTGDRPSTSPDRPVQAGTLQASLNDVALRFGTLSIKALGAPSDLGHVAQISLAAQSLQLALPDGPLELTGEGLSGEMTQAVLISPEDGSELVRLGRSALAGGALQQQQFTADTLKLAQGQASTWLDAKGQLNLLSMFDKPRSAKASTAPSPKPVPLATQAPPAAAPWRVVVKQTQLDEFSLGFEDRRVQPPLALRLTPIRAKVTALDTGSSNPMQLELQMALASGGEIQVNGTVHATTGVADLQLSLTDIALAPVQGYLSKFAALQLATGMVSSRGRLRYGAPQGAGAQLVFQGQVAVNQVLLEEVGLQRPFLSWAAVGSDDVLLTLTPNRLDMAELRIEKPSGRLIIAADQSVNLTDVLKKTDPATSPAPTKATASVAAENVASVPFPISIARVRVADGTLEFSDASLRPQFAARMHELKGVITGLSNDPDQSAKVQLDARVDQYGSAKIDGQISLLSPERLTEIDIAFRNLEMTSLSPYVVKFAGYRIAGGRLWLDLQYRVKDSKLLGENKVLLKQVVLGKKVESPGALNLPLELAIAILTDSDGVIDIALPVSGDLSAPQFDYGAIIGKAIGNLLGSIVSAPFKALAALFGGSEKTLDTVVFEPGSATLAPPERQKLAAIARALKERPALKLVVPPTRSEAFDTPVLKLLAVRRDIVTAMGISLAPDEDPGPVDVANARTQKAVETVVSTRYAPEVLVALKERALHAADSAAGEAPPLATSAAPTAQPTLPPAFYQGLLDRLVAEQPVSDEALAQLATQRSDAILSELTQTNGISGARTSVGQAQQARDADGKSVTLQLQLEVAK
jgi:hypothetical protein